jgi:hypothetical protein
MPFDLNVKRHFYLEISKKQLNLYLRHLRQNHLRQNFVVNENHQQNITITFIKIYLRGKSFY